MNVLRPEPRGMRLATWLAVLVAACVLPLVAVTGWLVYDEVAERQQETARDAAGLAQNVAVAIDQRLQARTIALQLLAGSPLIDEPARLGDLYRQAQDLRVALGSHIVVAGPGDSADGPMRMLLNTRVPLGSPLPPLPRPAGRAAVPLALQTGLPAVGDLFPGPIAGEPLVALAVPVAGAQPGRVVLATPEARQFQQRLDLIRLPPQWVLSLRDSRGEVIARRAPAGHLPAAADTGAGRYRVALAEAPWVVELEIPSVVFQAPAREAALALALIVGAATLLAVCGGLLAARRLRRAVAALTDPAPAAGIGAARGIVEIEQARRQLDETARRSDEALAAERAADARLRATFELANVGIAQVGLDGRWQRVNRRLCEIVGYTEAELRALTFQDITHPEDLDADLAQQQQLLAGQITAYQMDKRYRRRDGGLVWVALAVALDRKPDGSPDHFISVVEDIGARKRLEQRDREQIEALARGEAEGRRLLALAERSRGALLNVLQDQQRDAAALRASEGRLRNLFEQANDGIYVIGADYRFLEANERGLALLGCSRDELCGLGVVDVVAAHERPRIATELARMMDGEPHLAEWDLVRRDGTTFRCEGSARRLDEGSFLAIVRDLTERRRAEASLRESEAYRRRLFEQMADGVLLVEADGRIGDANPAAEAMFGCAAGELLQRPMPELLAADERVRWSDELAQLRTGVAALSEWELARCDGTHFPAELSTRPLDAQRMVAVLRDVSVRRETEQALMRYQVELSELTHRLLEQERATTRRVAQALHDHLGQTLALARLRHGMLMIGRGDAAPAGQDEALEQLGRLLEQAVAEARQVLADLRPPLLEEGGLAAALDNELRSLAQASGAGNGPVAARLQATPAAQAQRWPADAEYAAFMVAREAVANALRHAHASQITIRLDGGTGWLRLGVEDDGIGLEPALAHGRPGHLGIVGMRERALAIGAQFSAQGRAQGGTRVTLTWGALPR